MEFNSITTVDNITQHTRQINNENNYRINKNRRIFQYNNSQHLSLSLYIIYKFLFDEKSRLCSTRDMLTLAKKNSEEFVNSYRPRAYHVHSLRMAVLWPYVCAVSFYVLLYMRMNISILITTNDATRLDQRLKA